MLLKRRLVRDTSFGDEVLKDDQKLDIMQDAIK
jgi:hypothetical protein